MNFDQVNRFLLIFSIIIFIVEGHHLDSQITITGSNVGKGILKTSYIRSIRPEIYDITAILVWCIPASACGKIDQSSYNLNEKIVIVDLSGNCSLTDKARALYAEGAKGMVVILQIQNNKNQKILKIFRLSNYGIPLYP